MGPGSKKPRFSANETLDRVLTAGYELLDELGLSPGLDHVGINEAIRRAGVSRTSAYRLFTIDDLDPQDAFKLQLVAHVLTDVVETTNEAIADVVELITGLEPGQTDVQLTALLREILRVAGNGNHEMALRDNRSFLFFAALAAGSSQQSPNPMLNTILEQNERAQTDRYNALFTELAKRFGLRLRPSITWETFGGLAASAAHGVASRSRFNPGLRNILRPTGPAREPQYWSPVAMNFEALVLMAFEPDPEADVSADPSHWLHGDP